MNTIIATAVNKVYVELANNWIENLKKFNYDKNILICCLDKETYDILNKKVECTLEETSYSTKTRSEWIEVEKYYKYKSPLNYANRNKCNILFSDVDVVFLKEPITFFQNQCNDADIAVTSDKRYDTFNLKRQKDKIITVDNTKFKDWGFTDQHKYGPLNGAVAYYRYSAKLDNIFSSFFNDYNLSKYPIGKESGAAQTIFNDFVKFNKSIKVKKISVFDFANGSLLNVDYLKRKVLENACGIHYNFCENLDPEPSCMEKIKRIKDDGFWYI